MCALERMSQRGRTILGIVGELHRGRGNSGHSENPRDDKNKLPPGWYILLLGRILVLTIFTLRSRTLIHVNTTRRREHRWQVY